MTEEFGKDIELEADALDEEESSSTTGEARTKTSTVTPAILSNLLRIIRIRQ